MGQTYYVQTENPDKYASTKTVGQLIAELQAFDPAERVVFMSPRYGGFGSGTAYSIESVERVVLPREELHTPAHTAFDEEEGVEYQVEAETQVFHAWSGVVIR